MVAGKPVVFIVGLAGEDSGKTVLARSLVAGLREGGIRAAGFKPYAGARLWRSPGLAGLVVREGLVVSGDGFQLWVASGREYSVEAVNPITVLFGELDPASSVGSHSVGLLDPWRLAVLGRVSRCSGDRVYTLHWVNIDALRRLPKAMEEVFTDMALALKPYPLRSSDELARRVLEGEYNPLVIECFARIMGKSDIVVVESNSDIADPLSGSVRPSLVIAVAPGRAGVIEGERYAMALGVSGRRAGAGEVVGLAGVRVWVDLPVLEDPEEGYRVDQISSLVDAVSSLVGRG